MMHMTLYWGKNVTLLFDSWKTDSWTSYILSLIACFVIATFYQYLENIRIRLKFFSGEGRGGSTVAEIQTPLLGLNKVSRNKVVESVLFGVNSAIGYLLMLAIMSFNGGVFVAIVFGLTVGYFLFRSQGEEDSAIVVDSSCACA
ncbi:copper transporter 5-like protein [Trifolium pratense]|uniref:Copper transport protein n=1 Tax=Trifolium pratense TaxID=57577 RepID=A0A2K3NPL7_TRIPR|nr:copper transporter 5-like protein [Trifolium pratense]